MLDRNSTVMVYNYRKCKVALPCTQGDDYVFESALDCKTPTAVPVKISDIIAINTQSEVFRNKRLVIDPNDEEEVSVLVNLKYSEENCLEYDEVEDIILNPNTEKLIRLTSITDKCVLDYVKSIFLELQHSGEYLLAERAEQVITARYSELISGLNVRKSEIRLQEKKNEKQVKNSIDEEVEIKVETKKKPETVKKGK